MLFSDGAHNVRSTHRGETAHGTFRQPTGVPSPTGFRLPWQLVLLIVCAVAAMLLRREIQTSYWQALELSGYAATLRHHVAPGPADHNILFPAQGPFDERMGYAGIPAFATRLQERGFEIAEQSRQDDDLRAHLERGWFAPYAAKTHTGLTVFDCSREPLHAFRYPYRRFESFESVPPMVVQALLFIENRDLLDPDRPQMNPAVD